MIVGDREAHRDLAIVLFAELATVLPRDADRMRALLGEAGVVDDPGTDRTVSFDGGQRSLAHNAEHRLV